MNNYHVVICSEYVGKLYLTNFMLVAGTAKRRDSLHETRRDHTLTSVAALMYTVLHCSRSLQAKLVTLTSVSFLLLLTG